VIFSLGPAAQKIKLGLSSVGRGTIRRGAGGEESGGIRKDVEAITGGGGWSRDRTPRNLSALLPAHEVLAPLLDHHGGGRKRRQIPEWRRAYDTRGA